MNKSRFKPKKTAQLIAYIKSKSPRVSRLKLNMILWYVDMESYLKTGRSMTGLTYFRGKRHIEPDSKQLARA